MTDQKRTPESHGTDGTDRRTRLVAYGVGAVKWVFVLALFRLFAAPMTKDLLGDEKLPMPTWEWSLAALTPGIVLYLLRRPADWEQLSGELTIFTWALRFYLVYGLAFALFQGVWVLWIAVLAGIGGLAGIWKLERRELTSAH
ncbi:hypothetical protein [Streptomyces sp. RG80]|uniref:hypothetical protein n=1 Tax=Streptomyces sp. RG80 TaxID=3157340 RepID=UPI00338F1230